MARPEPALGAPRPLRDHGFHALRVADVVTETSDAVSLVFDLPVALSGTFAYQPGQFCNLRVEIEGEAHMRCYSMSSTPALGEAMQVTVKRVPGGAVSNWINDQLTPGDTVEMAPPAGFFQLTETDGDLVAFAAGSGITPVFSLVKAALATTDRAVRLHYANRDVAGVIFSAELERLQAAHGPRLTVTRTYDEDDGLLTPDAVTAFAHHATAGEFYVCGPAPYMEIVEQGLERFGVEPSRVHIERFSAAELGIGTSPAPSEPPGGSTVTIEIDGRTESIDHRPGTTILQTARQMDLAPPFSCESGSCATCMARLIEGSVSMAVNNALTPDEVADGWILTCQSMPTSASVHVVYGFDDP